MNNYYFRLAGHQKKNNGGPRLFFGVEKMIVMIF